MSTSTHRTRIILDGGFSRELIRLGAPFRQPEWSALALIEAPEYVRKVHQSFADAGADIITTNSYALVPFHIGEDRFKEQAEKLAALAGRLARDVANEYATRGRKVLVAGCLPPIFGSYEPERFDAERVQEYLSVLVRGLAPYVDLWLGETLSLIAEAEAVKIAIRDSGIPLWISFTLDDGGEADDQVSSNLRSGEPVSKAAHWALEAGVEALLFNCSSPEAMDEAVQTTWVVFSSDSLSSPAIGVYANAFESQSRDTPAKEGISTTREDLSPEAYMQFACQWTRAGASIIGGCCGIGHEHIRLLADELGNPNR